MDIIGKTELNPWILLAELGLKSLVHLLSVLLEALWSMKRLLSADDHFSLLYNALHYTFTITAVGKHWLVTYRHFRVYSSNGTLHTPWFQDWNGKVSCILRHPNSCETPPFQCCNDVSDCSVQCAIRTVQKICNDRNVAVAIKPFNQYDLLWKLFNDTLQ